MKDQKFSLINRIKSFGYAFNGLKLLLKNEHNAWIHLTSTIAVITLGLIYKISSTEWLFIVISICTVFAAELFNSSIEEIADFVSPTKHKSIKKVKDLAAAGVLITAVSALIVGLIIFIPKIT
jgi:diacylglycerol kinase